MQLALDLAVQLRDNEELMAKIDNAHPDYGGAISELFNEYNLTPTEIVHVYHLVCLAHHNDNELCRDCLRDIDHCVCEAMRVFLWKVF